MRKLTISTFRRAADAHATRQEITFEELIEDFRNPEVIEEPANEATATSLKLDAPAWSSGCFRNDHRAKEDFISASCLVYDLDNVTGLEKLLQLVKSLDVAFVVHSTTRSGFLPDSHFKLRLVFPLSKDHDAVVYDALWLKIKAQLGIEPDPTRRHPSGIYFTPVIFAEHMSSYVFECRLDGPYLGGGPTFTKKLELRDEKYWLKSIREATQKHEALNKAAFALAKLGVADIEEKCVQALIDNKMSDPVQDWSHARRTINKAIEDAAEEDPLEETKKENSVFVSPGLSRTANQRLLKFVKDVGAGADLANAAYELGRFVPHAIEADIVTETLLQGWEKCKVKKLNKAEAESLIQVSIASGSQNPVGVHDAWKEVLFKNADGIGFAPTESNTQLVISHHPELEDLVAWDVRQDAAIYLKEAPWGSKGRVDDADKREMGPWLARELQVNNISSATALEALLSKAHSNPHDVLLDYFKSLPENKSTNILDRVLIESSGAPDTEYVRLATRYWFTSVYARQLTPGCPAQSALILSGKQGVGKSTFFKTIFPKNLQRLCSTDVIPDWDDKDCKIALSKYAVVELPELDYMSRKTVEAVKKFVTEEQANIRPAFGRVARSYPRRAVFGGSTNKKNEFLVDPTGNRRFWPVSVQTFDVAWNEKHRDIIWAQARFVYESTRQWWPESDYEKNLFAEAAAEMIAGETFQDELKDLLAKPASSRDWKSKGSPVTDGMAVLEEGQKLGELLPFISTKQIALILGLDHNKPFDVERIKRAMQLEGWEKARRVWVRPSGQQE